MKTIVKVLATVLTLSGAAAAQARDINVGVSIAGELQPGVYGQVHLNTAPAYSVYPQQTVIVQQPAYYVPAQPVYVVQPHYYGHKHGHRHHHRGHGHGHRRHHHHHH